MSIFELSASCPACELPAKPGYLCPHCQLTQLDQPGLEVEMVWKPTDDFGFAPTSYNMEGPIHVHVGRWQNPGPQEGMWHVHIHNTSFFLPAELTDQDVLYRTECAFVHFLVKMTKLLMVNVDKPSLPVVAGD